MGLRGKGPEMTRIFRLSVGRTAVGRLVGRSAGWSGRSDIHNFPKGGKLDFKARSTCFLIILCDKKSNENFFQRRLEDKKKSTTLIV